MNHCCTAGALFPEPVRCTGALGAGAAEARALTEKMPESFETSTGGRISLCHCGSVITIYYNGRHDWRVKCQHCNMTEDGSVVQPSGPKKLKHYTESQSTCLVVNLGFAETEQKNKSNGENRILSCLPVSSNILIYNICQASNLQ